MYARIEWTSYQFKPPETVAEELYSYAKSYPVEFHRQFVNSHLISGLKQVSRLTLLYWGVGAALVGVASLFDFKDKSSWADVFGTVFAVAGVVTIFSGILTAGSFLKYAIAFRQFWLRVTVIAHDSDSYSDFLRLFERRKTEKLGLDRELPFWLPWLVLIGIALALYAAAVKYANK